MNRYTTNGAYTDVAISIDIATEQFNKGHTTNTSIVDSIVSQMYPIEKEINGIQLMVLHVDPTRVSYMIEALDIFFLYLCTL